MYSKFCCFLVLLTACLAVEDDSSSRSLPSPNSGSSGLYSKGQQVLLNCTAEIQSGIKWFLNNKSIDNVKTYTFNDKSVSFVVDRNSIGVYHCLSIEGKPQDRYEVHSPPYADNDNKVVKNAIHGETFVFECKGFGFPAPEVQWFNQSMPLELGQRVTLKSSMDGDRVLMVNNSLRIQPVEYEDQGVYTCVAKNGNGNFTLEVEIHVKDKFAAMWPFLGICLEVAILCIIIFIYEKRRSKKAASKDVTTTPEEADKLNPLKNGEDIRQRK